MEKKISQTPSTPTMPKTLTPLGETVSDISSFPTPLSAAGTSMSSVPGPSTDTPFRPDVPDCRKQLHFSSDVSLKSWSSDDTLPPDQLIIADMLARLIYLRKDRRLCQEQVVALTTKIELLNQQIVEIDKFLKKECSGELEINWL